MATVPSGQAARVLLRVSCPQGHQMSAYGLDAATYWPPESCVKCGAAFISAEKIADLSRSPRHRYAIKLCAPTPAQAAAWPYRQEICADHYEVDGAATVFYASDREVGRYRRMIAPPQLVA